MNFLQSKTSHNFENGVAIIAVEQLRKQILTKKRKKELLRTREAFWQKTLRSIQRDGLNKRIG